MTEGELKSNAVSRNKEASAVSANLVEQTTAVQEHPVQWKKHLDGISEIRDLYTNHGLTAEQIGARLGMSKGAVLRRLESIGVKRGKRFRGTAKVEKKKC
jgi:DUF2075 family protein